MKIYKTKSGYVATHPKAKHEGCGKNRVQAIMQVLLQFKELN